MKETYNFIPFTLPVYRWVGFLLSFVLYAGCSLENDLAFIPETQAVFTVILPDSNQTPILYRIEDSIAIPFGPPNNTGEVETLSGNGNMIGMSSAGLSRVWIYDAEEDEFTEWAAPDSFIPHSIAMGLTTIMVCDSIHNRILFLNPESSEVQSQKQIYQPSLPFYRSGKFFVISGSDTLITFQESAFAQIGKVFVGPAVTDIYTDARVSIYLIQQDGSDYFETIVDFNSQQIIQPAKSINYSKRRSSPFKRASFGKEYTGGISLALDGRITRNVFAQDFEADFLESELYFIADNQLRRYNLFTENRIDFFVPGIKIISYFSYTDPVRP